MRGVNPVDRYGAEGAVAPDGPLPRTLGGEAAGGRIVSYGTSAGREVSFNLQTLYRKSGRLLGYGVRASDPARGSGQAAAHAVAAPW